MKSYLLAASLAATGMAPASAPPAWVERLAAWAAPELRTLQQEIEDIGNALTNLPPLVAVNSGNRTGWQSAPRQPGQDLWVEVDLGSPSLVDRVVLIPLLARGSTGQVPGYGFPRRFLLEGMDETGSSILLMDETNADFPHPGSYPVSAACPPGTVIQRIRLTAIETWPDEGAAVLALSEMLVLHGNRSLTGKAKVRSTSSREIPPTWSRNNLVDLVTPLGLPLAPQGPSRLGWHGAEAPSPQTPLTVTVDLGRIAPLDEIRLIPAWRSTMVWDSYYGFPIRFRIETSTTPDFGNPTVLLDRSTSSLLSPGQNLQTCEAGGVSARYVRVTTSRLRDRDGTYIFALGELQAYSGQKNIALNAPSISPGAWETDAWSPAGLTDGAVGGGTLLELPDWIQKLEDRRLLELRKNDAIQQHQDRLRQAEQTLVAGSIYGAGGIMLLAGLFTWRGHRHRVIERGRHRERLARDLHDELGSNLGSIALISSFAAQEDETQMRQDLAEIERVARESADSMRDMVSLLAGRGKGTGPDWLQVMASLATRLLRGVQVECRLPTAPLLHEPNLETRRELYLFCKEVLHNAARHAQPRHLAFHLSPTTAGLRILIRDDGCGFEPGHPASGHGLGNLRERAAMLRATMTLTSAPGQGTTVLLDVPRGRRWTKR